MDKKPIEISQSSLLSLKAEILKKQQEVDEAKLTNRFSFKPKSTVKKKIIKNPGVEERNATDEFYNEIDSDVLKQSRIALEAKSKLYDKLSKTIVNDEDDGLYLVQFNKKSSECADRDDEIEDKIDEISNIDEPGDEWVEYTDCLGRSRMCLRKDLPFVKSKDQKLSTFLPAEKQQQQNIRITTEMDEFNERREQMRQQWEAQERDLMNKDNIHYQDVLFDEARSHGVGYFNFSHNEEERIKQQEELQKLRQDTKSKQQEMQELKQKRDAEKAARIRAVKNRQRARLGLPPLEEEDPEPKSIPIIIEQTTTAEEKTAEEKANEKVLETVRNQHIRPWDIGKKDLQHEPKSQQEWIQDKRKERPKEFAPPSTYTHHHSRRRRRQSDEGDDKIDNSRLSSEDEKDETEESKSEKSSSNYQRYAQRLSPSILEEDRNPLRFTTKKASKSTWRNFYPDASEETPVNPYKKVYNPVTSNFTPTPIVNKVEESSVLYDPFEADHAEDDDDMRGAADTDRHKNYAEIPPPATMEYYGSTNSSKMVVTASSSGLDHLKKKPLGEIQASIEAGLKFLRKQSDERKHAQTEHVGFFD